MAELGDGGRSNDPGFGGTKTKSNSGHGRDTTSDFVSTTAFKEIPVKIYNISVEIIGDDNFLFKNKKQDLEVFIRATPKGRIRGLTANKDGYLHMRRGMSVFNIESIEVVKLVNGDIFLECEGKRVSSIKQINDIVSARSNLFEVYRVDVNGNEVVPQKTIEEVAGEIFAENLLRSVVR